jgi:hypothetical protein
MKGESSCIRKLSIADRRVLRLNLTLDFFCWLISVIENCSRSHLFYRIWNRALQLPAVKLGSLVFEAIAGQSISLRSPTPSERSKAWMTHSPFFMFPTLFMIVGCVFGSPS